MQNLNTILAAALACGLTPDSTFDGDGPLSVGHGASRPFGGKLSQRAGRPLSIGAGYPDTAAPMGGPQNLLDIVARFGGRPCQVRGEPMPTGDCASRLCLTQLFYSVSVAASATAQSFDLRPRDWFQPIAWVDYSPAAVSITAITYKGNPVFESTAIIIPSSAFPATSNWNFVIGIPAISSNNGYILTLANSTAAAVTFAGRLIGVGMRSA